MILSSGIRIKDTDGQVDLRVINVNGEVAAVCDLTTEALKIYYASAAELLKEIRKERLFIVNEAERVIDENELSEAAKITFDRNCAIVNRLEKEYGPDFIGLCGRKNKPVVKEIIEEYGIAKSTFWKITGTYIKSGCRKSSLLGTRRAGTEKRKDYQYSTKTGRPKKYTKDGKALDKNDITNFDIYVK